MSYSFVSYSRRDSAFVARLKEAMTVRRLDLWVDVEGIRPSEQWRDRLQAQVEGARAIVFVLSPDWIASDECRKELDHALRQSKKLIPLVCRDVPYADTPDVLRERNWIFARDSDDLEKAVSQLADAIETDLQWVDSHTAVLVKAREWEAKGREASLLLRGAELRAAEDWLAAGARHPKTPPTVLHAEYILAGRRSATRRQRILWTATATVLLVVGALTGLWYREQENSALQKKNAEVNKDLAAKNKELADTRAKERDLEAKRADAEAALKKEQAALRSVADSYRLIYRDPLRAAVSAQRALKEHVSPDAQSALAAVYRVALAHRANRLDAATLTDIQSRSFEKRAREGAVYSVLSRDGRYVLLTTETRGAAYNPELRGEVYLLDNETLRSRHLAPCGGDTRAMRLEYAGFAASGRQVFVTRAFYVDVYDLDGKCADGPSLQFEATKSPVHLVAGYLNRHFVLGADSLGNVWLLDATARRGARPIEQLGRRTYDTTTQGNTIVAVDVSPDEKSALAVYESGRLELVTVKDDGGIAHWPVLGTGALGASFHPQRDRTAFLTSESDGRVRAWRVEGGRLRQTATFRRGAEAVDTVAYSDDGSWIVSIDSACRLSIWDSSNGQLEREVAAPKGTDCTKLARADAVRRNAESRRAEAAKGVAAAARAGSAQSIQKLPVRGLVKAASREHKGEILKLAYSADNRLLVSASADGAVRVWDPATGKPLRELTIEPFDEVQAVAVGPKGLLIAAATSGGKIRLWRTSDWMPVKTRIPQDWEDVQDLAFSPDGKLLAIAANEDTVRIWSLEADAQKLETSIGYGKVRALLFRPDGGAVIVGSEEGPLTSVDVRDGTTLGEGREDEQEGVIAMSMDRKGIVLATTDGTEIVLWSVDPLRQKSVAVRPGGARVTSIALSGDGRLVAAGLGNGAISVWNVANGNRVLELSREHGSTGIGAVSFAPLGPAFVSGGGDHKLVLWQLQ